MKTLLVSLVLIASLTSGFAAQPSSANRKIGDMNVIPTRVLQRSISPRFYRSLLISPVAGWVVVRANLSGTRLTGARVIHSELQGLYDPLALQLAKEALIAGNFSIDRPNMPGSVLLHVLVYRIADGTMVLSFAHLDHPGGNQMEYYGCARLLTLKADKWTEIQGPESLQGKGWAVRQGIKNSYTDSLKLEGRLAAESTNYNLDAGGRHDRRGY
jgi:hypothetical protein